MKHIHTNEELNEEFNEEFNSEFNEEFIDDKVEELSELLEELQDDPLKTLSTPFHSPSFTSKLLKKKASFISNSHLNAPLPFNTKNSSKTILTKNLNQPSRSISSSFFVDLNKALHFQVGSICNHEENDLAVTLPSVFISALAKVVIKQLVYLTFGINSPQKQPLQIWKPWPNIEVK
ncbi:hypothetical protein HMI55_001667 [Coelomomyces lativittatus]|nr:hypothetical protein HMI55_001667 [Coelomomyces lativittatus]